MIKLVARFPGSPEAPPKLDDLLAAGIPRGRALLGVRIGELRSERGMTHHSLGKAAQMNGTNLKRIELGQVSPNLKSLLRLTRLFNLSSLEQLFGQLPTEEILRDEGLGSSQVLKPSD